ncbi:MAG: hypothetical protein ACI9WU_002579 [Myxococcota bacterium]
MIETLAHLDQLAVCISLGLVLGFGLQTLKSLDLRSLGWCAVGLLLVALGVRLAFPPAFVHSNFHGTTLAEQIAGFPQPSVVRAYFGQASFVVLGIPARLASDPWRAILVTNALCGTAALGLLALLAHRAGGRAAGLATLALGALYPGLVRVAASEDAHNVGLMFGALSLVLCDSMRRQRRFDLTRLGLAAAATILAIYSRHTFHPWPALALALLLPPGGAKSLLWSRRFLLVVGMSALLCLPRLAELFVHPNDAASYRTMIILGRLFGDPTFLLRHPLLRLDESVLVTPLLVMGIVHAWRQRSRVGLTVTVAVLFWVVLTLPFNVHPSYNEEYAFRLPLLGLAIVLAGIGAGAIWRAIDGRWRRNATAGVALALLTAAPATGLARLLDDPDPQHQELTLILSAPRAPTDGTELVIPDADTPYLSPSYRPPRWGLTSQGWSWRVHRDQSRLPAGSRVYLGLGCYVFSPLELARITRVEDLISSWDAMSPRELSRLSAALWDAPEKSIKLLGGALPTDELRPECRRAARRGVSFEPWGTITIGRQQAPHAFFTRRRVPIGVWTLGETAP